MTEAALPNDHDLLIRLDQKVDTLHDKVSELTDDHEKRIRGLETAVSEQRASSRTWRYGLSMALALITVTVTVMGIFVAANHTVTIHTPQSAQSTSAILMP